MKESIGKNIKFWTDFDGTITRTDFGHVIITEYGTNRKRFLELEKLVENGKISLREGLIKEYNLVKMTEQQMFDLAKSRVDVDEYFGDFMEYAECNLLPVTILSDGFRNYIEYLLEREGIGKNQVIIKANEVKFNKDKLQISFPHSSACDNCANCKRAHIDSFKEKNSEVFMIYAGDGLSDLYGSKVVDHVFARRNSTLERYLKKRKLSYEVFSDYRDILSGIRVLIKREEEEPGYLARKIAERVEFPFPCVIEAV